MDNKLITECIDKIKELDGDTEAQMKIADTLIDTLLQLEEDNPDTNIILFGIVTTSGDTAQISLREIIDQFGRDRARQMFITMAQKDGGIETIDADNYDKSDPKVQKIIQDFAEKQSIEIIIPQILGLMLISDVNIMVNKDHVTVKPTAVSSALNFILNGLQAFSKDTSFADDDELNDIINSSSKKIVDMLYEGKRPKENIAAAIALSQVISWLIDTPESEKAFKAMAEHVNQLKSEIDSLKSDFRSTESKHSGNKRKTKAKKAEVDKRSKLKN